MPVKTESVLHFLDSYLEVDGFPDYPNAHNGLQVQGGDVVTRVGAAVDAGVASIAEAAEGGCDLLLVHHGLFWDGGGPLTGRRYDRLAPLIEHGIALYAAHLPLDAHPEVGNCVLLSRALDVDMEGRFGTYEGVDIGWWGRVRTHREELRERTRLAVGREVRLIPGGPEEVRTVGVVTGGGGSMIREAADAGLDAFVTGEGPHHTYLDAMEMGVNVYYAGHYATETWGVRALARTLKERFDLPWEFIDQPTGL